MKNHLKVAAYCRVSTESADQLNSLNSQLSYFSEYINSQENWSMHKIYYDEGITGTNTKKRNGFNQMIMEAFLGEIDLIITKEISRFARNTVDALSYTRQLKSKGIGVIFILDHIDTRDNDGELRLTIMASLAQEESRKTSERVKWGQKRRMEQGIVFGRDLLGYKVNQGVLSIQPEEAETVKKIFFKFLSQGKGTHIIARELQEEGFYTKSKKKWSNTAVLRILKNEKYVGDLCQKKTCTLDYLTHKKVANRGLEDQVYIRAHHLPIIDRNTWERTQEELKHRNLKRMNQSKHSECCWCSGKLFCGVCDRRFVRRKKTLAYGKSYTAFRCCEAAKHGREKLSEDGYRVGCNNRSVNEKILIHSMTYLLERIICNKEVISRSIAEEILSLDKLVDEPNNISITKKITHLEEKKQAVIDLMLEGILLKDDMIHQLNSYNEKIRSYKLRLEEANQAEELTNLTINMKDRYIKEISNILELSQKQESLYKEMLNYIIVHTDNQLDIYLKCFPFGFRLSYHTRGKEEGYQVEISSMDIIYPQVDG